VQHHALEDGELLGDRLDLRQRESAGGSRLWKVRMHVWHFESQRLVVSR